MTQKRTVSTKALSAYLKAQHTSLSAAIQMIGGDQEQLQDEVVNDGLLGRIARLRGTTPDKLADLADRHATA
jgi:hypothetical protein